MEEKQSKEEMNDERGDRVSFSVWEDRWILKRLDNAALILLFHAVKEPPKCHCCELLCFLSPVFQLKSCAEVPTLPPAPARKLSH